MHRNFISDRSRRWPLLGSALTLCACLTAARAAEVTSAYVVVVPENDPSEAVQDAMRVELVRLTGMRESVSDPALAPIVDAARQYVQIARSTTSGQTQVLFDATALRAAIEAAGNTIWDLNRPLLWVSLPVEDAATDQQLRGRLAAAAQERGLPVVFAPPRAGPSPAAVTSPPATPATTAAPTAPAAPVASAGPAAPAAAPAPSATPAAAALPQASPAGPVAVTVQAPSATGLLESAHRAGANAALVAQADPNTPGSLQWTLAAPTTSGQWSGGPELAIENATEALASAARAVDQAPLSEYDCHISGVSDLASLVGVLSALRAAPGISEYTVEDVDGQQLTLRLKARANVDQLQRMLANERLQAGGTGAGGVLEYRYLSGP